MLEKIIIVGLITVIFYLGLMIFLAWRRQENINSDTHLVLKPQPRKHKHKGGIRVAVRVVGITQFSEQVIASIRKQLASGVKL